MNINRHNYEEYFILYMDNELSTAERLAVEEFIQHHPDLKDELDTLMQFKLAPDTHIIFERKEELLKVNGQSPITSNNYEEWFSLYIDNELTAEERQRVDKFMAANPALHKELDIFQKTKLRPKPILFPHKNILYRKEEKTRRPTPLYWRAAAAVLLLVLGISSVIFINKKPNKSNSETAVKPQHTTAEPGINNNKTSTDNPQNDEQTTKQIITETKKKAVPLVEKTDQVISVTSKKKPIKTSLPSVAGIAPDVNKKEEGVMAENNKRPSKNLPLAVDYPNINIDKSADALVFTSTPDKNKLQNTLSNPVVTSRYTQPLNVIPASYHENVDEVLDLADEKKNINRGIFRKIARTFEKRTNIETSDDNKLLIAGLAIKLK